MTIKNNIEFNLDQVTTIVRPEEEGGQGGWLWADGVRFLFLTTEQLDYVSMARLATGTDGKCADYVRGIADKLAELGIDDPAVREFWEAVQQSVA